MYFEQIGTVYNNYFRNDNNGKKRDNMGTSRRGNDIMIRYQEIRKSNPLGARLSKNKGSPQWTFEFYGLF
jgi:hypothetical protein